MRCTLTSGVGYKLSLSLGVRHLVGLRHCASWREGHCVPLVSKATTAELIGVLAYPKFNLSDDQHVLLADHLPWCATVRISNPPPVTPSAAIPLINLFCNSVVGKAGYRVNDDKDLLCLANQFGRPIVFAEQFLKTLPL